MAAIRLATAADAEGVLAIYAPMVRETSLSFELEPPTLEEMKARIRTTLDVAPWLICEQYGHVMGYAYAKRFWPRAAYQWAVEVSVYVHPEQHRQGVGRGLYTSLFELLRLQGYQKALAIIALPNPPSIALHQQFGFTSVGVFHAVGHKFGIWRDSSWWEMNLGDFPAHPEPPKSLKSLTDSPEWQAAIRKGEEHLMT